MDDLEDKTDCKIKAVAQIDDIKVEIESQVFVVKAQAIKISLTDGTVLGAKISDAITSIKSDKGDMPLNKATVSLSEGCRDVKLVRWPSSEDNSPAEVENSLADAEDIYLASKKKQADTNCVLIVSTDEGKKHGAVPLSAKEADYSITKVHEPDSGQMQIDLQEKYGTENYKLYMVYNNDDTRKKWYEPGNGGNVMANGAITLNITDDNPIPDSFYYKIEDRVLFWVHEPTIVNEIVVRENEGMLFSVGYISDGDKLTLANTAEEKCDATLYQVNNAGAASYSVGAETYPSITPDIQAGQIKRASDLFIIGYPENCELRLNGKAIGSFASSTEASGVGVTLGSTMNSDSEKVITVTAERIGRPNQTAVFVLDDASYVKVDAGTDDTYTSTVLSGEVDTALVRTYKDSGTWLVKASKKNMP